MTTKPTLSVAYPTIIVSLLFITTLLYSGPSYSLHLLAICSLLMLVWLTTSMTKLDIQRPHLAWGWLPMTALAYVAWLLLNPFLSTYPYASLAAAMQLALLPLALLGWLILPNDDKDRVWKSTWRLLLIAGVLLAAWGIIDFFVSTTTS